MEAAKSNGTRTVHFGLFEVDLKAGELRRNGARVRLQEQPFQVLSLLLEHPGEVVTREELQERLWPADTFVDFDHSLNAAIRRLRDALGDSAENPRFVETVARRGYRFLAPVNGAAAAVLPEPSAQQISSRRWQVIGSGAAVLLVGIVFGWITAHWSARPVEIKQRRLTVNPEDNPVTGAALSPNGKYLAYSDSTGVYLREIASGEAHPLSLLPAFNAVPAAWYSDGTHLVATWVEGPKASPSLWQISLMGGAPRKLIDDAQSPAFSADGLQIAFLRGPATQQEIWVMQADGEKPRRLVAGGRCIFGAPVWSPDGDKIAYVTGNYEPRHWEMSTSIEMFDFTSRHSEEIHSAMNYRPGLVWTRDGRLIYSVSEPPPNQNDSNIWSVRLDRHGHFSGTPSRLTVTQGDVAAMSASADGKRIAYTKHSLQQHVYVAELNSARTRLSTPRRLTLDEANDYPFAWTPDSQAVLFTSDRDGTYHIFKQRIDQSMPELFVGGDTQTMVPRVTPDDSSVVYELWPKLGEPSDGGLMRVPLAGGPPETVLKRRGIGNLQCARPPSTLCLYDVRSRDQMLFFSFDPATGQSEEIPQIRIQDEPSYAYNWSLSPDGKTLATAKRVGVQKDPSITLFSLEDGSHRTITAQAWAGISSIDFAADGRSLWAPVYTNTGKWALLNIGLQGSTRTMLEDTNMMIGWAIPAPDGKHLALWKARESSNVWMLQGF